MQPLLQPAGRCLDSAVSCPKRHNRIIKRKGKLNLCSICVQNVCVCEGERERDSNCSVRTGFTVKLGVRPVGWEGRRKGGAVTK